MRAFEVTRTRLRAVLDELQSIYAHYMIGANRSSLVMSMQTSVPRWRRGALVGATVVLAIAAAAIWFTVDRRGTSTIELTVARNRTLIVEMARTAEDRARGLSDRVSVTHDGLLLVWDAPGRHPIWMADMRFALDIAWLDASGRVLALLVNVPPCDRQPCPLYEPPGTDRSTAVLELPSGGAARHGITVGSAINTRGVKIFVR